MHIPDGYISPQTALSFYAIMMPIWGKAIKKVKQTLNRKQVPLLAICTAFSFTIMMFNVPIPGGSSAHAVGAVLIAILLGPWAACIGVSMALVIQALIFGDGGIWAIGANCFNIAFIMSFVGYYTYKLIMGKAVANPKRQAIAAGIAGYVGLNAAALLTAIEFGIQPLLFHTADGTPLYCMYPLSVTIPAMMLEHLLIAGFVEAFVTTAALAYVRRANPKLFDKGINTVAKTTNNQA